MNALRIQIDINKKLHYTQLYIHKIKRAVWKSKYLQYIQIVQQYFNEWFVSMMRMNEIPLN